MRRFKPFRDGVSHQVVRREHLGDPDVLEGANQPAGAHECRDRNVGRLLADEDGAHQGVPVVPGGDQDVDRAFRTPGPDGLLGGRIAADEMNVSGNGRGIHVGDEHDRVADVLEFLEPKQ